MSNTFDLIVIGAGALGSAAAYHAARRGARVLLLEQFEIDHQRGSSYGHSRIIRYAYDHPLYVEMAKAVYPMWAALEDEADETLFLRTGGIDFAPSDHAGLTSTIQNLREAGIPHEVWSPTEAMHHFPQFRIDEGDTVLYQADAGVLRASRCVRTHVRLAQYHGAYVEDHTLVLEITPTKTGAQVKTPNAIYSAAHVIVTAGAWTRPLIVRLGLDMPLTPVMCQENYFDAAEGDPDRFPIFISHDTSAYGFASYGLPSVDDSGVKVGLHGGAPFDPDTPQRTPSDAIIDQSRDFIRRHLPGVSQTLRSARVCLYTMTPDEHFIIDRHPAHPQIIIGACCSGHAFKFSTLIGRLLTDLALTGQIDFDLSMFRLGRFDKLQEEIE